mgnify:CR=1 FL=1
MIWSSFTAALGQLADPRFRRVLWLGLALTVALLVLAYAGFVGMIQWLVPDMTELPLIGPVSGIDTILSVASVFVMLGLSVFLMVPVASAFTGLFLEEVVQAVEDRHYPVLPPARKMGVLDGIIASVNFLGLVILVNLAALLALPFVGPLAPVMFWAVNGWLLGQEYFTLVAMRRMPRAEARGWRRANRARLWLAGTLMAVPLTIPLVNLLIPLLGVATFTHLFHRIVAAAPQR